MGANNRTLAVLGSVVLVVIVLAGWGLKALLARPKPNAQSQRVYSSGIPAGMTLPTAVAMPAGMPMPPGMKLPRGAMAAFANILPPGLVMDATEQEAMNKLISEQHLSKRAAAYLVKSKIQLIDQTKTSLHFLMTFPDGGTIDETLTLKPNQPYTPTAADLERAARGKRPIYNPRLTSQKHGDQSVLTTLEYNLPYSAVPKELLDRIDASMQPGTEFFTLVPSAWGQARAIVEPSVGLVTNALAEHWKGVDKLGEEFETGKSLGIDAPLALLDLFLSMSELGDQLDQIGDLQDCAKNPTNPLTQKASQDPNYQHDVLDPLSDAKGDVASSGLPRVANVAAGYLTHFLPFGSGFLLSPVLGMNDDAINSINEERIKDAEKSVVECDKESEMTAFGYRPMTGKFEYKYNDEYKTCNENGCNHNKTVREATGTFEIDPNATEATTAKYVGAGFIKEDGGFENSKCHGESHTLLKGPLKITPEVGGMPEAAIVKLIVGGDMWEGKVDGSQTCGAMPPVHDTWNTGAFGLTCEVKNINMVKGGSATAYVEADRGHGTCTIELQRK